MKRNSLLRIFLLTIFVVAINCSASFAQWIINESFEGGALPTSWTTYDVNNDGSRFRAFNKPTHAHTGNYICFVDCYDNDGEDWLVLPQIAVQSGYSFNFFARSWYGTEDMVVKLSTTGNAISNFNVTLGNVTGIGSTYQEFNYDLSSWAGQNVYLAIKWNQDTYAFIVDDIKVGKPVANDVGVLSIISPTNFSVVSKPVQPIATIKNFGTGELTADVPVSCRITDQSGLEVYNQQITYTDAIIGGGNALITFPAWTPTIADQYNVEIKTTLTGDADITNDILTSTTEIVLHYGTGGPDAMGYKWIDSGEPEGPDYNWVDISATGQSTIMFGVNAFSGDDNFSEAIPIGFGFPFYGITRTFFHADINGTLLLADNSWVKPYPTNGWDTDGNIFNYYEYIPGYEGMPALISVFWDDMVATEGTGNVFYQTFGTSPSRYTIIQWNNLEFAAGTGGSPTLCFQVVLYENGEIIMQYKNIANGQTGGANPHDFAQSATIGIQSDDYSTGLAYLNENVDGSYIGPDPAGNLLSNEMAIKFYPGEDHQIPMITANKVWNTFENTANFNAIITDMSGLESDSLYYNYGSGWLAVAHDSVTQLNHYHYSITGIPTGVTVNYKYVATDNSEFSNRAELDSTLNEPLTFDVLPTTGTEILVMTPGTLPGFQDYQNIELPEYVNALTNADVQFDIYNWAAYESYNIPSEYKIIFAYSNTTGTSPIHDTLAGALMEFLDSGTETEPKNLFFASDNLASAQHGLSTTRNLPRFTNAYLRAGFVVQPNPPIFGGTDGLAGPESLGLNNGSIIGVSNSPIGTANIEIPVYADDPDVIDSRACPSWYAEYVTNPDISSNVSFKFEDGPISGNAYSKGNPCAVWLDNLIYKSFFISFDISQLANDVDVQTTIDEALDWFIPDTYTVTVEAIPGDGGVVTGGGVYVFGSTATVTATAGEIYEFVNWSENETVVSTNPSYTFTVTSDRNLVANFNVLVNTLIVSANPPEGGSVSGGGVFLHGIDVTVSATAAEDYSFLNWTADGVIISTDPEFSLLLMSDTSIVANFASQIIHYELSLESNPVNGGTVTGAGTYIAGEEVTVTAEASDNFSFEYWKENDEIVSTEDIYTFNIEGNRNLTAWFRNVTPVSYIENRNISIMPNPADDEIKIINAGSGQEAIRNIEIFNYIGRKQNILFSQIDNGTFIVNMSKYPAGFYIIRLTLNNGKVSTTNVIHR